MARDRDMLAAAVAEHILGSEAHYSTEPTVPAGNTGPLG